jgi:hypothetical protein
MHLLLESAPIESLQPGQKGNFPPLPTIALLFFQAAHGTETTNNAKYAE